MIIATTSLAVALWERYGQIVAAGRSSRKDAWQTLLMCSRIGNVWLRWTPRYIQKKTQQKTASSHIMLFNWQYFAGLKIKHSLFWEAVVLLFNPRFHHDSSNTPPCMVLVWGMEWPQLISFACRPSILKDRMAHGVLMVRQETSLTWLSLGLGASVCRTAGLQNVSWGE